jgi:hypothetical protein
MRGLTVKRLNNVVKDAKEEQRFKVAFLTEVSKAFGSVIVPSNDIVVIAEAANDRLNVLERTGRGDSISFDTTLAVQALQHEKPEVRRLGARFAPERFLAKASLDQDDRVRSAAANRLPLDVIKESLVRFPKDDQLRTIYKEKRKMLAEAGLAQPKVADEPFDMYGEKRMGDAAKSLEEEELSDVWYEDIAENIFMDYGRLNIDTNWQVPAVRQYVRGNKSFGFAIDEKRLLKAVLERCELRDDAMIRFSPLRSTVAWLEKQGGK